MQNDIPSVVTMTDIECNFVHTADGSPIKHDLIKCGLDQSIITDAIDRWSHPRSSVKPVAKWPPRGQSPSRGEVWVAKERPIQTKRVEYIPETIEQLNKRYNRKITTITAVTQFSEEIQYLDLLARFVPVSITGQVWSITGLIGLNNGNVRGMSPQKNNKSNFKNLIPMMIRTPTTTRHVKISKKKIQICGGSSIDEVYSIIENLCHIFNKTFHSLERMMCYPDISQMIVNWIATHSLGDNGKIKTITFPRYLDYDISSFLASLSLDAPSHASFVDRMHDALNVTRVDEPIIYTPVIICEPKFVMMNSTMNIDWHIDRTKLANEINKRYYNYETDMTALYINTEMIWTVLIKKTPKGKHTFTVYESGNITQSTPISDEFDSVFKECIDILTLVRSETEIVSRSNQKKSSGWLRPHLAKWSLTTDEVWRFKQSSVTQPKRMVKGSLISLEVR